MIGQESYTCTSKIYIGGSGRHIAVYGKNGADHLQHWKVIQVRERDVIGVDIIRYIRRELLDTRVGQKRTR